MTATTPLLPGVDQQYLDLIGAGDEWGATDLVLTLWENGAEPERLLLDLIAPAQVRVGELWAADEWSVAREHGATATSERAIAALIARAAPRPTLGRITVACTDGEWHALPPRLLGEVLRLRGWRVDFLDANVPGPHLVTHLHQTGPDVVALSCALPTRLPRAHATLTACQAVGVPVLAGGRGFGTDGRHARLLGADGWAATATDAADILDSGWNPPARAPHDDLAHLADEEYTQLVRQRHKIIVGVLDRLRETYPPMRSYDIRQADATAEDVTHIVDFLAAALYVDDATVFTDFLTWTAAVLAARRVPAQALTVCLDLLGADLRDFPRAGDLLERGLAELSAGKAAGQDITRPEQ
ncbi:methanogenic corrinoid protein MtbC1 [Catenuloplanes nepalensis]|uniref:Methanogenic corrinoid protein MtbC1 n=1 Tax=Catenuloplanes nepalensis TaxID=587533 RepID=A0ABT9MWC9_9ACTN|nr:cobalamin B12-binding domain-containing protein [Catenuloplanes nepalensis]MDP9795306.1 methanogenic corrinoid protein MtbC1 [Catenuloplanes nepalensis]